MAEGSRKGCSVLTLVRGRKQHLRWLMVSLAQQVHRPDELVIAYMQPHAHTGLPDVPFDVTEIFVEGADLPIAAARNAACRSARYSYVLFLDVDCICGSTTVLHYSRALQARDAVFQGQVKYLPSGLPAAELVEGALSRAGAPHPSRPPLPDVGVRSELNLRHLWGLSFAIRRDTYERCGGMDEGYRGYGGEDTDFGMTLKAAGAELYWLAEAPCYHQHHACYSPPLNHFSAIIKNATRFHRKWGSWCLEYWLSKFEELGLVRCLPDRVEILRCPTPAEIRAARAPAHAVFA